MVRKSSFWILAAGVALTGCASGDKAGSWSAGVSRMNPWSKPGLSEEFKEAKRSLTHPEKTLVAYARMKEDNEEYAEARDRYREIMVAYPDSVQAQLGLARIEMATGRFEQAEEQLASLVRQRPEDPEVRMVQGLLYSRLEDWDRCIESFQQASELKPDDQGPRFELGVAYVKAGRVNEALPHLKFAVGESAAMYNVGYILQEQGQSQEAAGWYREALAHHPDARTASRAEQALARMENPDSSRTSNSVIASAKARSNRPGQSSAFRNASAPVQGGTTASPFQTASASSNTPVISPGGAGPFRTASSSRVVSGVQGASYSGSSPDTASGQFTPGTPLSGSTADAVPQWGGPSSGRSPAVSIPGNGSSGTGSFSTQDPPAWRAAR